MRAPPVPFKTGKDLLVVSSSDVPGSPQTGEVSTLVGHHVAAISVVDEIAP